MSCFFDAPGIACCAFTNEKGGGRKGGGAAGYGGSVSTRKWAGGARNQRRGDAKAGEARGFAEHGGGARARGVGAARGSAKNYLLLLA